MAQRKETKTTIKVRDLKPSKDAKGGFNTHAPKSPQRPQRPQGPQGLGK